MEKYKNTQDLTYNRVANLSDISCDTTSTEGEHQNTKKLLGGSTFNENNITTSTFTSGDGDDDFTGGSSKSICEPVIKPSLQITTTTTSFLHIFQFATTFDYF